MAPEVQEMPADWYRTQEGLGVWEGRSKSVAVGVGVSPTDRRWDSDPQTSVGAYALIAAKRAMEDAGVTPTRWTGLSWYRVPLLVGSTGRSLGPMAGTSPRRWPLLSKPLTTNGTA